MKCENCKKAEFETYNYGMHICYACDNRISIQLDGIRDTIQHNQYMQWNNDGTHTRFVNGRPSGIINEDGYGYVTWGRHDG